MAPDRGDRERLLSNDEDDALEPQHSIMTEPIGQEPDADFLARQSEQPQFTIRALTVGMLIGVLIAFSNTYFGLQTGWISGMAMPSALIGFAYFKGLRTMSRAIGGRIESLGLGKDFSEVENVLVQTVAGSVGTMPLGCGFVGVVPALEFLLKPSETPPEAVYHAGAQETDTPTGGIHLTLAKLILWSLGLCFFGVVFAVPLRKEVIIREKLKFPSGTATALMIGVLHGGEKTGAEGEAEAHAKSRRRRARKSGADGDEETQGLISEGAHSDGHEHDLEPIARSESRTDKQKKDWQQQIRLLTTSFGVSGAYVCPSNTIGKTSPQLVLIVSRLSSRISFRNFTQSPFWVYICQRNGCGTSTQVQPTWDKASSWVQQQRYICCSALYLGGPPFPRSRNLKAGHLAPSMTGILVLKAGLFGSVWQSCSQTPLFLLVG